MDAASLHAPLQRLSDLIGGLSALPAAAWGALAVSALFLLLLGFILGRGSRRRPAPTPQRDNAIDEEQALALKEHTAAREAADLARIEAEDARRTADADLVTAMARAERAEALASGHAGEQASTQRALAESRAESAAARAAEAALRETLKVLDGTDMIAAISDYDEGRVTLADAVAAADTFFGHHAASIAAASRIQALAALGQSGAGLDTACRHIATARLHAASLPPAAADDVSVLHETLQAAARLGKKLLPEPAAATAAGLPRLAEALWRDRAKHEADVAARGKAMAAAAEAALWGGRWSAATMLARQAISLLDGIDDPATLLAVRVTNAQASVFSGAETMLDDLVALADDTAEAMGEKDPLTLAARRLAARAAYEAGDAEAGEALAARLADSGIDPLADPATRAARARGLLLSGHASDARGLFEALARQAQSGSRAALGHSLDALDAALTAGDDAGEVLAEVKKVHGAVADSFGLRHPRCGHVALLTARAEAALGNLDAAASAMTRAEALLALRLDPNHRWRVAVAALQESLAGKVDPETMESERPGPDDRDGTAPPDSEVLVPQSDRD